MTTARARLSFHGRVGWLTHVLKSATQQHHKELDSVFRPLVPADGVVFDVGAHAGQFSKLFARMAKKGRVFAFEPSAYARSVLGPALAWNGLSNVEVAPLGLSDAEGASILRTPLKKKGQMGYGLAHLGEDGGDRKMVEQTVPLTTLDAFFAEMGLTRLDFIKADVEGWEAHVLRGGRKTIAAHHPALFLEVVESSLARAGAAPDEIWAILKPLGYRSSKAPDFEPCEGYTGPGDYLFTVPRG